MGIEVATYISELDATNPLAGDKKNQGDDHFRLIKAALKATLPNSDRAFRFPEIASKSADETLAGTVENNIILVNTSGGAVSLTLPTPSFDGWMVRIMKTSTDANPVYVVPPSGTINGLAKMRLNVPYMEYVFLYTGSAFIRIKSAGEIRAGSIEDFAGTLPVGYALATGQSLVRADHPELFEAWGTTWGAPSGTTFSAPNLQDVVTLGAGSTYALTGAGGAATRAIAVANLPAVPPLGTSVSINDSRIFSVDYQNVTNIPVGGANVASSLGGGDFVNEIVDISGSISGTITGNLGSGTAFDIRQPYVALNKMFRLC